MIRLTISDPLMRFDGRIEFEPPMTQVAVKLMLDRTSFLLDQVIDSARRQALLGPITPEIREQIRQLVETAAAPAPMAPGA